MSLDQRYEPLIASLRQHVADAAEQHVRQLAIQFSAQAEQANARAMLEASERLAAEHRATVQLRVQEAGAELAARFDAERLDLVRTRAEAEARHRDAEGRAAAAETEVRSLQAQLAYLRDRLSDLDHAWRLAVRQGRLGRAASRLARRATVAGTLEAVVDALGVLALRVRVFLVDGNRLAPWASRGFPAGEVSQELAADAAWCRGSVFEASVQLLRDLAPVVPFPVDAVAEALVAPVLVGEQVVAVVYLDAGPHAAPAESLPIVVPDIEHVLALATPMLEAVTAEQVCRAALAATVAAGAGAET